MDFFSECAQAVGSYDQRKAMNMQYPLKKLRTQTPNQI